jgi:uncharacterized tellurite resistance protein B-like protein
MTFWNRMSAGQPPASITEAGLACAVAALTYSGPFTELESRLLSIFRDQFAPLSRLTDAQFDSTLKTAIDIVQQQGAAQNVKRFIHDYVAPAIPKPDDRMGAYRYAYAMAMVNLNVDTGEQAFLTDMKAGLGLDPTAAQAAETAVLTEFATLHQALASVILGLIIIAADGQIKQEELDDLKADRALLDSIAKLDETQFDLVYDMAVDVYNRFLMDAANRRIFLYNIIVPRLGSRDLRTQAFHFVASIATSDGEVSSQEIETMKDILTALGLSDQAGEAIFGQYMSRVHTIDGQPAQQ